MSIYDEPEHDPLSPIPELDGLSRDDAIEAIKEWFFQNFEDPVVRTPYESAEGGYIYIWGGPYGTRDIVENVFADAASDALITAAIDEIERDGNEWVPSDTRHRGPEDEEPPGEPGPSLEELHALMRERLGKIKEGLAHAPEPPAGLGHNRPPEPLEPEPFTQEDKTELFQVIETLEAQPIDPPDHGEMAEAAVALFESKREKLAKWLLRQGEVFTTEAVKEAGKQFGTWAPRAFWLWLLDQMFGVSHVMHSWLHLIKLPF